jgi:catalase
MCVEILGHSVDGFPAYTPEESLRSLAALNSKDRDAIALQQHVDTHPAARRFLGLPRAMARSFVADRFFMLHWFRRTRADGSKTVGRLQLEPPGSTDYLSEVDAASGGTDFLREGIRTRISSGFAHLLAA